MPSNEHTGHYCTCLEMCKKPASELTSLDAGIPSAKSGLGYCPHCPAYVFFLSSETEKQHHLRLYHPKQRKSARKAKGVLSQFCKFKLDSERVCGKGFSTIYQLCLHRKNAKHQRQQKVTATHKTGMKSTIGQSYAARLFRTLSEAHVLDNDFLSESDRDTTAAPNEFDKDTEALNPAETWKSVHHLSSIELATCI